MGYRAEKRSYKIRLDILTKHTNVYVEFWSLIVYLMTTDLYI